MGALKLNHKIDTTLTKELPGVIIVLPMWVIEYCNLDSFSLIVVSFILSEHIVILKSFGRVNDYTISPSQEVSNVLHIQSWMAFI